MTKLCPILLPHTKLCRAHAQFLLMSDLRAWIRHNFVWGSQIGQCLCIIRDLLFFLSREIFFKYIFEHLLKGDSQNNTKFIRYLSSLSTRWVDYSTFEDGLFRIFSHFEYVRSEKKLINLILVQVFKINNFICWIWFQTDENDII